MFNHKRHNMIQLSSQGYSYIKNAEHTTRSLFWFVTCFSNCGWKWKPLRHNWHLNLKLPVCSNKWYFKLLSAVNPFPQYSHLYIKPSCPRMCDSYWAFWAKPFLHCSQYHLKFPVWSTICLFNVNCLLNSFEHFGHCRLRFGELSSGFAFVSEPNSPQVI